MEVLLPALEPLLEAIGPLVDANEIRQQGDAWLICLDPDLGVLVESDAERQSVVLTTELGRPHAGGELQAYRELLYVGASWRAMAGLHMALDPEDDMVLQIAHVPWFGLDALMLQAQVQSFADTARHCREVLASIHSEANTSGSFLRV